MCTLKWTEETDSKCVHGNGRWRLTRVARMGQPSQGSRGLAVEYTHTRLCLDRPVIIYI